MNTYDLEGNDGVRYMADVIGKYVPALPTVASNDATEREVNKNDFRGRGITINDEVRVLREVHMIVLYSYAIIGTCVEVLLNHCIIK